MTKGASAMDIEGYTPKAFTKKMVRRFLAVLCIALLVPGDTLSWASPPQQANDTTADSAKIPNDRLDSLVAPIALHPDPLLAQMLVASTYPLEIIQLQQWLAKNNDLKGDALVQAAQKQGWDPSIQALAPVPDLVKQLSENIKWTTDLGNAFLVQQSDVMDAVQRMRAKAKNSGTLKSTQQQVVETKVVESRSVVVIQPASPEVVYVPSYNPVVVYGPPAYPYPPLYYPPPGYYAAGMALSFGLGVAMGAAWGGGWGWHTGWGGNNITINNNNNFVSHYNSANINRSGNQPAPGSGNNWQHNPQHRGGAPYDNRATAKQEGGTARGDSMATRQASARQNAGQMTKASSMDHGGRSGPSTMDRGMGSRGGGFSGGGGERVGNRSVSNRGSGGSSAFGGGSGAFNGSSARASSARGGSSMRGGGGSMRGFGRRR